MYTVNRLVVNFGVRETKIYRWRLFITEKATEIMYNFTILFIDCLKQCIINFKNLVCFSFNCFHFLKNNNSKIQHKHLPAQAKLIMENVLNLFEFDDEISSKLIIDHDHNKSERNCNQIQLKTLKLTMDFDMMKIIIQQLLDNENKIPSLEPLFLVVSAYMMRQEIQGICMNQPMREY